MTRNPPRPRTRAGGEPLDEEGLIARFLAPFPKGERVVIGPGSDCAAVTVARGQKLVSTTDAVVEGVHFDWRWFSPEQVGHKALAVNLSDLAAAGAQPRWFLCALGIPRRDTAAVSGAAADISGRAQGIARGMAKLARRFGCALIGGNVTSAREWSITITALGESPRPLSRTGAKPGDAIVVCGKVGAAAAGLRALRESRAASVKTQPRIGAAQSGKSSARPRTAALAQQMPEPLLSAGLSARGVASAAIDVSDGFLRDLQRLCDASGAGAEVDCDLLPLGPSATLDDALTGGEDYALVFAVPPRRLARLAGVDCVQVGRFAGPRGIRLTQSGRPRALPARAGFDHLR
ncbi:MAG TPA: thiamine-phosphate kinase [Myxococcales bacterium]